MNNAGIASLHGIEWGLQGVDLYRQCMEVNYLGVVRVTKTALPLLRKTPGSRVVIVTSVEDRAEPLTQPSYAASKFATRAFANSVRRELRLKDIFVSVIEPSFLRDWMYERNFLDSDAGSSMEMHTDGSSRILR